MELTVSQPCLLIFLRRSPCCGFFVPVPECLYPSATAFPSNCNISKFKFDPSVKSFWLQEDSKPGAKENHANAPRMLYETRCEATSETAGVPELTLSVFTEHIDFGCLNWRLSSNRYETGLEICSVAWAIWVVSTHQTDQSGEIKKGHSCAQCHMKDALAVAAERGYNFVSSFSKIVKLRPQPSELGNWWKRVRWATPTKSRANACGPMKEQRDHRHSCTTNVQ